MDGIKIEVTGNIARVIKRPARITAGTVGLPVEFAFDSQWDGLSKTAVFRAGRVSKIVDNIVEATTVPWEVLKKGDIWLSIGVYGVNADGSIAIPTIWANVCVIQIGVSPDGDPSTQPEHPAWQKALNSIGNLEALKTDAKNNLVDAVNEVATEKTTDKTLTKEGFAADAKATGEKFGTVTGNISGLAESIEVERARITNLSTLPNGSTTGDAELADIRVGLFGESYGNAGEAVRGQVKDIYDFLTAEKENERIEGLTGGHLKRIAPVQNRKLFRYKETNGVIAEAEERVGSWYIKCPEYLAMFFPGSDARAYVYFYDLVDGEYVPRWDIINTSSSVGVKNYLSEDNAKPYMFKIPDGVYMRICVDKGKPELYGWDGVHFGMPLSADYNYPKATGWPEAFSPAGSFGITIPGDAEYLLSGESCGIYTVIGYKGKTPTQQVYSSHERSFIKLPSGYDFFRARLMLDGTYKVVAGDISGFISVVVSNEVEKPSGKALTILDNCKKVCNIRWTPKAEVPVSSEAGNSYQPGIEYMGIPYGSDWRTAHYIGWHVSPHTFVNAVNDEDSIFYKETVYDGEVYAPYYSLVCSAFATLCAGWPYPQVNRGCLYDPNVEIHRVQVPPIGALYSSMVHVVIPERIDHLKNDVAVSVYEHTRPTSQRTTRYRKVVSSANIDIYHLSNGADFFDDYGYVLDNYLADPDMSVNIPYIDTSDVAIVGGGARPYKGDKSVYTSAESSVRINIKDADATTLYLIKGTLEEGVIDPVVEVPINGASQIDVKPYLVNGDGIYSVWTNTKNGVLESFEYRTVETITYEIMENGAPKLSSKDFWYAMFAMRGDRRANGKVAATSQLPADDYSYLVKDGAFCSSVFSIFRKGIYGAYNVPFVKKA